MSLRESTLVIAPSDRPRSDAMPEKVFAGLFLASLPMALLADTLNGLLIASGTPLPVSPAFKIGLLGLSIMYLAIADARRLGMWLVALCTVLLIVLSHQTRDGRLEFLWADLQWALRGMLALGFYLAFRRLATAQAVTVRQITLAFWISGLVVVINLLLGLLGFGFAQYDDRFGTAGFFFAGNELAACMVIVYAVIAGRSFRTGRLAGYILLSVVALLAAMLTLTKTAVFGVMLIALLIPAMDMLLALLKRGAVPHRASAGLVSLAVMGTLAAMLVAWFVVASGFWDRMLYFLGQRDLVSFLLSGRNQLVARVWQDFFVTPGFDDLLVGRGVESLTERYGAQTEMDPVDLIVAYGLPLGLVPFLLAGWVGAAAGARFLRLGQLSPFASTVAGLAFVLLLISTLAGHVFNSGVAAPFLGAALGLWSIAPDLRESLTRHQLARSWSPI